MAYYYQKQNTNHNAYLPKRPIKSFQDLEVYQKALEAAVFVARSVPFPKLSDLITDRNQKKGTKVTKGYMLNKEAILAVGRNTLTCALNLPHLIAEAHSFRFGSQQYCLLLLEKVMRDCNKMAVYLDQVRDICATGLEWEQFDELIKKYFCIRRKVLNLQRSWKRFMEPAPEIDLTLLSRFFNDGIDN